MAELTVPTQQAIIQRVKADFRAELGVEPLRRSVEYALIRALGGQSKGLYATLQYIFREAFPTTAKVNFWRWASLFDITQKPATAWTGVYRFTGNDGTAIPSGTLLARADGKLYETTADAEVGSSVSGRVDVAVEASEGGTVSNCDDETVLVLSSPVSGVDSDGEVQSTTVDGTDVEDIEDGLARLLQRLREPPSGGVSGDYVRWALEVEGVTRAWENSPGPGEVTILFVRDDDGSGAAILPNAGERSALQEYVQSKAPITVTVGVLELTAANFQVEITDLSPDTLAVRSAIDEALADFFVREAEPGGTIFVSRLREAISGAAGEVSHTLVWPAVDTTVAADEMPIYTGLTVS